MENQTEARNACKKLFVVSFITLFLELMIIRWVPANIRLLTTQI